jgi:hypothetical protein
MIGITGKVSQGIKKEITADCSAVTRGEIRPVFPPHQYY